MKTQLHKKLISDRLLCLIDTIVDAGVKDYSISDKLNIIISESQDALLLLTNIEDEFEIELDDDDIDIEFFTNIDIMINSIEKACKILTANQSD